MNKPIFSTAITKLVAALAASLWAASPSAQTLTEAITSGTAAGNLRLRYEDVDQQNALGGASALTLRSTLQYSTKSFNKLTATMEAEDVRIVAGVDEYAVPQTGFNKGLYSTIADPETTEISQAFLQYASGGFTTRVGRQVINLDNQRFIGNVGWRQDWQVFDALKADYKVNEQLALSYSYLGKRKRVFADAADINSNDHLFHLSYATPIGAVQVYSYLLDDDSVLPNSLDTYGVRLSGEAKQSRFSPGYVAEFATQKYSAGTTNHTANYYLLEGSLSLTGLAVVKLGYENLGSDGSAYGFATPLATLHIFNGWADMFLTTPVQGLQDRYLDVSGKQLGGTWSVVFHDYAAAKPTSGIDDLGSEIDVQFVKPFGSRYTVGIKYADFTQGDLAALPDTRKLWLWGQLSF